MSVISLSSGDEDECIILDSDDEDSGAGSLQTHQVFIVERNQSCSVNEEVVLQNITKNLGETNDSFNSCDNKMINLNSSSVVNSCLTLPITNTIIKEHKSESSLKLLAEKLAKVLGNNYSDVAIEQYDKAIPETNMSSLEKTIFDVSRGSCTKFKQGNNILGNRTGKKTKGSRLLIKKDIKKIRKSLKKINSDFELSQIEMQSSTIQSVQIVSEAKTELNQNSSQATRCVDRNTNIQTNKRKRSLKPVENHKKKLTKHAKPPFPQNSGPYDNKLKFTFDRIVSAYSVSVVSSSKPEQSEKNVNSFRNSPHENNDENSIKCNGSSCQKTIQLTADFDLTKPDPIDQPELIASSDFRSSPSPLPFSDILNLKSSFVKHHNIVFDDKTDVLCVEMGDLLLQIIEEEKNFIKIMAETQSSHNFLLGSDKFETAAQTCRDALLQSKRKFIDNFSQVHDQINIGHVVGTQLKIVLLTAWFMKMFLSITTKFPNYMDILHGVRIEALKLLSEETVKWPLISKTFIKDENQFYLDCVLVLELIKDCLKDQNDLISQSNLDLDQIVKADKPQTVTSVASNNQVITLPKEEQLEKSHDLDQIVNADKPETVTSVPSNNQVITLPKEEQLEKSHDLDQIVNADKPETVTSVPSNNQVITLPKELQKLEKAHDLDVFVVNKNSTETKTTNYNGICKAKSNPAKHFNIPKTNLENRHELSSTIGYNSKPTVQILTNPMQDLHYQYETNLFLPAQSDKQYCSNYTLSSNTHVLPNIPYQPRQPNYHNHDISRPSKHSQTKYNYNNQAHYQESSTNRFKTTTPIILNSFHPTNLVASNSNMEQFPVIDGGGIEISSCPITINNYNITHYSPELKSKYYDSPFRKKGEQM